MHTVTQLLTAAQDLASACQKAKELLRLFGAPPDQLKALEVAIEQYHRVINTSIEGENHAYNGSTIQGRRQDSLS